MKAVRNGDMLEEKTGLDRFYGKVERPGGLSYCAEVE